MILNGESVVIELWVLLAVVLLVYLMRLASRRILLGAFSKFQFDDYLMSFTVACFIVTIFGLWIQCMWGNNYVRPDDVVDWTPHDFALAKAGSKWSIVLEVSKVTCVWGCKFCLLILYGKMTKGLPKQRRAVYYVTAYVAAGYIIVIICFFAAWCRPFHVYYDIIPVPDEFSQCSTYRHHMILDACFNITGDAVMLCLPIPLVIKAKVPLKRKLTLVGVFGLGGLVILCAILNRVTNFTAPWGSLVYLNWYAGEISTAVIVANVPHLWPLISKVFKLGSFKSSSGPGGSNQYPLRSHRSGIAVSSARRTKSDQFGYLQTGSEERFATNGDKDLAWGYSKKTDSPDSSDADIEAGKGCMTTQVHGGHDPLGVAVPLKDQPLGGWEDKHQDRVDKSKKGHIVKTVHINQYASDG